MHAKAYGSSIMYDQIREDIFFIIFYTLVTAMALMASCYLLFRDGNAFAADITPPLRLRRWVAAFFASIALNHAWYMPILFLNSSDDVMMTDLIGGLLDCMTFFPLAIIVLLAMLQDRKRPLWPVAAMMAPIIAGGVLGVAARSYALLPIVYVYFLLMCIGLFIYMVRALKQYGRWLRDNYADLEHKEVWQSFVVLAIILLVFGLYAFTGQGPAYQYGMQVIIAMLICYLLWRVETLSDLSIQLAPAESEAGIRETGNQGDMTLIQALPQNQATCPPDSRSPDSLEAKSDSQTNRDNIGTLLQQHCIDTQLYLQHDLNLSQLAQAIGTNRTYLTNYFVSQGITYNTYINNLRIQYFLSHYHEAVASKRFFTAQELAHESGYQSYSTFSLAFKNRMGQTVTAWMRDSAR